MTETQKRIRAYKRALPHMKERVIAVALLLAMSVSMMSSATFAWLTLSRSPEVSGLATTIATNGNLEIALSDKDGLEPDETAVGDGGKVVTLSNLTWGNLINLSDPSYGLEDITLRPATLNSGSLDESPLYAVTYGADGRIEDIAMDFSFTNYQPSQVAGAAGQFVAPVGGTNQYGVRAVSSVKATTAGAQADLFALNNAVTRGVGKSVLAFKSLYGNSSYIQPITKLAGIYITYRINDTDQDCTAYITPIYKMMTEFGTLLDQVGETVLAVANLQHYLYCDRVNSDDNQENNVQFTPFDMEDLLTGTATDIQTKSGQGLIIDEKRKITLTGNTVMNQLLAEGFVDQANDVTITALKMYVNAVQQFGPTYTAITEMYNKYKNAGTRVGWEALRTHINVMANIYTATINGTAAQSIGASDLGDLTKGGTKEAKVLSGLLVDMDQLLGTNMLVEDVEATVSVYGFTQSLTANVTTNAQGNDPHQLVEAANLASDAASGGVGSVTLTATDTYGMAIDFWVRTNSPDSLLTLEGEFVTETRTIGYDDDGKPITQEVVVGYQGANRVWEKDDPALPVLGTSTTQGSGSCYVFYPDTPEDQAQSLKLLQAMCVAFISDDGRLLAQADLDTGNVFEDGGRVLVPLKLRAKSVPTGEQVQKKDENGNPVYEPKKDATGNIVYKKDENGDIVYEKDAQGQLVYEKDENGEFVLDDDGNKIPVPVPVLIPVMEDKMENSYHIMELEQNEAQRITAVIYLDGSRLSNSQVLAAGSIKGQMNIQFGTTENIVSVDNKIKAEYYNIIISGTANYKPDEYVFDENNKPSVDLTFAATGISPKTVKANFVSVISGTQGAKQPTFSFTKGENGWTAHVVFNGAGEYQLRSIQIDGVDYALSADQIKGLTFEVTGTSVNAVRCTTWDGNSKDHMTANSYYAVPMEVELGGKVANTVQGVFVHNEGQNVTVNFTLKGSIWTGTANFNTSGEYEMTYMIIDGVYVPLAESQHKSLELTLGLNAQVFVGEPVNAEYKTLEALYNAVNGLPVSETATAATVLTDAQVTLVNSIIDKTIWTEDDVTHLTEAEKTALKTAIGLETFADDDQKALMLKAIEVKMESVLDVLHSDVGDGLALQMTAAGYEMLYSGGEDLFMEVSCIITDNKGNMMTDFSDVDLYYGVGTSQLNQLTAMNMTKDQSGRYEGELKLSRPGLYNFQKVVVDSYDVNKASSAPSIRAISPKPIGYAGRNTDGVLATYTSYYENITASPSRWLSVGLVDAPSAEVVLTLAHWNYRSDYQAYNEGKSFADYQAAIEAGALTTYQVEATPIDEVDNGDGTVNYYFGVNLANGVKGTNAAGEQVTIGQDGVWRIVGMDIKNVFYKEGNAQGVYYDGIEETGGTGWLNFDEKVFGSDITTEFFTTVNFKMIADENTAMPNGQGNSGAFMADHLVKDLKFVLTDYLGNALPEAKVGLKYVWDKDPINDEFEVVSGTAYPNTTFGADSLTSSDGKTFPVMNPTDGTSTLNFQLAGTYEVTFSMSFKTPAGNVKSYAMTADPSKGVEAVSVLTDTVVLYNIPVSWTLPDVKITAVTGATKDSVDNDTFTVNLANDSDILDKKGWSPLEGAQNYFEDYYANVYYAAERLETLGYPYGAYTVPEVTMKLSNEGALGTNDSASFVVANNEESSANRTYTFTKSNNLQSKQKIGDNAGLDLGIVQVQGRAIAGRQEVEYINMVKNGITYKVKLNRKVVVNQQHAPIYLDLSITDQDVNSNYFDNGGKIPVRPVSKDGKTITLPDTITLPTYDRYKSDNSAKYVATSTTSSYSRYYYKVRSTRWEGYRRDGTLYSKTALTETIHVTKSVTEWTVNGVKYSAGTEIPITAHTTATAQVVTSESSGGTTQLVTYKWYYTYANEAWKISESRIKDAGYTIQITSTDAYWTSESTSSAEPG